MTLKPAPSPLRALALAATFLAFAPGCQQAQETTAPAKVINEPLTLIEGGSLRPDAAEAVAELGPPGRALLAYHSALHDNECRDDGCALSRALGFEHHCGRRHVALVQTYLPGFDLLNCVYLPANASAGTTIERLALREEGFGRYRLSLRTRWRDGGETGLNPPAVERWLLAGGRLVRVEARRPAPADSSAEAAPPS